MNEYIATLPGYNAQTSIPSSPLAGIIIYTKSTRAYSVPLYNGVGYEGCKPASELIITTTAILSFNKTADRAMRVKAMGWDVFWY